MSAINVHIYIKRGVTIKHPENVGTNKSFRSLLPLVWSLINFPRLVLSYLGRFFNVSAEHHSSGRDGSLSDSENDSRDTFLVYISSKLVLDTGLVYWFYYDFSGVVQCLSSHALERQLTDDRRPSIAKAPPPPPPPNIHYLHTDRGTNLARAATRPGAKTSQTITSYGSSPSL